MKCTQQERATAWQAMLAYVKTLPNVLGSYQHATQVIKKMRQREQERNDE